jgi:NTE family protein
MDVRRGLVLGGGGQLGGAWTIGALCALEEVTGWDPRTADVILGTSAGAFLAALLGSGAGACDLAEHQRGVVGPDNPLGAHLFDYAAVGGAVPQRPRLVPGSGRLLRESVRSPRSRPALTVLSGLAPLGRGSLQAVGEAVGQLGAGWSANPAVRVAAVDYDSGRRTVFGDEDAPDAELSDAVTASCAIPGWFAPVEIGGRRYVDGGAWSATNADVLLERGLDEVYVLAPMAARAPERARSVWGRMERGYRRMVTRRLLREARLLRAAGIRTVLMAPGPEDLEVMGFNVMDASRRVDVLDLAVRTGAEGLRAG